MFVNIFINMFINMFIAMIMNMFLNMFLNISINIFLDIWKSCYKHVLFKQLHWNDMCSSLETSIVILLRNSLTQCPSFRNASQIDKNL